MPWDPSDPVHDLPLAEPTFPLAVPVERHAPAWKDIPDFVVHQVRSTSYGAVSA